MTDKTLPAVGATVTFRTASKHGLSAPKTGTVAGIQDNGPGRGGGVRVLIEAEGRTFKVRPSLIQD